MADPLSFASRPALMNPVTIPAATVVIFRHPPERPAELLMVQRAPTMRFAGGATVFPGGRVDPADATLAVGILPALGPADGAARIAGIRETLEETGLAIGLAHPVSARAATTARRLLEREGALAPVLAAMGWRVDAGALVPFAHWCPDWHGAFDTRFYLADLGTGAVMIAADATENTSAFWIGAAEALRQADAGNISVIFPTRRNLERLAQFASFTAARDHAAITAIRKITPARIDRDGETWLTIPDGLGYPVLGEPATSAERG